MKPIYLVPLIFLYSCSNSGESHPELQELNGTWLSICTPSTNGFFIKEYTYNNGSYSTNTDFYSDSNCSNSLNKSEVGLGTYSFNKNVVTVTGLTATIIDQEVILPVDFQPKSVHSVFYIDNNILYFAAYSGDFDITVLIFDYPNTKTN